MRLRKDIRQAADDELALSRLRCPGSAGLRCNPTPAQAKLAQKPAQSESENDGQRRAGDGGAQRLPQTEWRNAILSRR